jgi:hypothetical protein
MMFCGLSQAPPSTSLWIGYWTTNRIISLCDAC